MRSVVDAFLVHCVFKAVTRRAKAMTDAQCNRCMLNDEAPNQGRVSMAHQLHIRTPAPEPPEAAASLLRSSSQSPGRPQRLMSPRGALERSPGSERLLSFAESAARDRKVEPSR